MDTPPHTIVETAAFLADAKKLMTDDERAGLVDMIAAEPTCGDLIVGGGGIRKVRYAIGSKGKSSGIRVVYFYSDERFPIFLLAVFAKNERSNLSQAEVNALAKAVKTLISKYGG